MPDLLSDDDTRAAFASLRSSELARVRPPGTDAVRRTVSRRRTTRAVTIAGCLVLAIGGGVALAANPLGRGVAPAGPPDRTATDWSRIAVALMPPDGTPGFVSSAAGPLDANIRNVDETAHLRGYRLRITCAGAGAVHVKLEAGGATAEADVSCGAGIAEAGAATRELKVAVPAGGANGVAVAIEPDAAALKKAGFAYVIVHDVESDVVGPESTGS
jgi:hypothetical protein